MDHNTKNGMIWQYLEWATDAVEIANTLSGFASAMLRQQAIRQFESAIALLLSK